MNKYIDLFYKAFFKIHYICFFYILLLAIASPYQDIKWAGAISLGIVIVIIKKCRTYLPLTMETFQLTIIPAKELFVDSV